MRIWLRRMELKIPLRRGWLAGGAIADVSGADRMGPEQARRARQGSQCCSLNLCSYVLTGATENPSWVKLEIGHRTETGL